MTDDGYFVFECPECQQKMSVSAARNGRRVVCVACGRPAMMRRPTETGFSEKPITDLPQYPRENGRTPQEISDLDREEYERLRRHLEDQPPPEPEGNNPALGWLIFLLIFVVGNIVLYVTTGWVLIPRR